VAAPSSDFLAGVPLFEGVSKKELSQIADAMVERSWRAGDVISVEGGPQAVSFFVIESGTVDVEVGGSPRRSMGPGDHFGEVSLLGGTERTATLTAATDVHAYGLTPWTFLPMVKSNATISFRLFETIGERLAAE
jgi:CRP-like cAMP-binding protein